MPRHMIQWGGSSVTLLIVAVALSCESGEDRPILAQRDTLSGGRVVVTYPGVTDLPADTARLDLRIGAIDGAPHETFGQILGLDVDSAGRIYALDGQAAEVRLFSAVGEHIATIGGQGEGPGELDRPNGIALGRNGVIWVNDPGHRALIALSSTGEEVAREPRLSTRSSFTWKGSANDLGVLRQPVLHQASLDASSLQEAGLRQTERRLFYKSFDPQTNLSDSVYIHDTQERWFSILFPGGSTNLAVPFEPALLSTTTPDGEFWVAHSNVYSLAKLTTSGDTALFLRFDEMERIDVTERDRASWLEGLAPVFARTPEARTEVEALFPAQKPVLDQLIVDDSNLLWVRRTVPTESLPVFDLFTPDAQYVGSYYLPVPVSLQVVPVIRNRRVYAVTQDDLGVEYIAVMSLPGG